MKKHNISRKKRTYKKYNKPQFRNFNKYTNLTRSMKGGVNWFNSRSRRPTYLNGWHKNLATRTEAVLIKIKSDTLYDWLHEPYLKQQHIELMERGLDDFRNKKTDIQDDFFKVMLELESYYKDKEKFEKRKPDETTLEAIRNRKASAEYYLSKINEERIWVKRWIENYIQSVENNVIFTNSDNDLVRRGWNIIQKIIARLPVSIADEMYLGATVEEATAEHERYQKELEELAIRNAKDKVVRDSWMNIVGPREEEIKQKQEVERQKRQEEVDKELRKEVEKEQRKANFKKLTEFFGLSKEDSLPPISQPPKNNLPSDQEADNTPSSIDEESGARTRIGARKQGLNNPLNYDKEITYGQELSKDIARSRLEKVMGRMAAARFGNDEVFQNDESSETEKTGGKSKYTFKRNVKSKKKRKN